MSLDFLKIVTIEPKKGYYEVRPKFNAAKSSDLMIRGKAFYAVWDKDNGLWSCDEYRLIQLVDEEVKKELDKSPYPVIKPIYMADYDTGIYSKWKKYCKEISDNYKQLDTDLTFADTKPDKEDYSSKRLSYSVKEGDISAYEELVSTLYNKAERRKIEWAIGSIIAGDSKDIQKFYVLYGPAGAGKSTILNIIQMLFPGYYTSFKASDLGYSGSEFALESFASNPLIAIDHDGDMSRVENNTLFNKLASHEPIVVNEKFKAKYNARFNAVMFIASNQPVRITDAKSGLLRRLIDISPSGRLLTHDRYNTLMTKIAFELPGIAYHCLSVYLEYGKQYYDKYRPTEMLDETNDMYNFVSDMLWEWEDVEEVTLASAWEAYKKWSEDANVPYPLMKRKFKTELKNYFKEFIDHTRGGFNIYRGLLKDKFRVSGARKEEESKSWLIFSEQESILDKELSSSKAQYATEDEVPSKAWFSVKTTLKNLDTKLLHYVMPPKNHIVIDFDLKNSDGEKDLLLNQQAASKFPETYAELSKGGEGLHLHYIYDGDVDLLSRIYDDDIEVKVFTGNSSLRRKLTKCNSSEITTINSGLPLKGEKSMVDEKAVENERHLRALIKKCLNKENHGHTRPEIDFLKKLMNEAYDSGVSYDVRDLRSKILTFAMDSTNQAQACYDIASKLPYCSKDHEDGEKKGKGATDEWSKAPIIFVDVEVFPNLFVVCWKYEGEKNNVVKMINPKPEEIKQLFKFRIVGFNNRRYDNHILYARSMGYTNPELFRLSQRIIGKNREAFLGEAYGISFTDIYDYCSNNNKMSLKKWEIKLGLFHMENSYPWDEDIAEEHWTEIADYCANDVIATEAVWNATQADFRGRQILAELSGLTVNDTSNTHTQQIIFGNDRHPQDQFKCPDLSKEFPGYEFKNGVSTYMGETVGEGGWVYSRPGMYYNAVCEDVSGMHPASVYAMKLFGDEYTERYYDLVRARTYIKHKDYDKVRKMFDGKLTKYLGSEKEAKELSNALKTPINSVYGLTAAHFPNRCRDPRNKDNVVAKRGALFMITLKNKVEEMGYTVIHCKTDSIKVADPDEKILKFIEDFGKKYGYAFEIEDKFERICLVNKACFIAKMYEPYKDDDGKEQIWFPKAEEYAHPYIFKTLFSGEPIEFNDLRETKEVKSAMYLDFNENYNDTSAEEKELKKLLKNDPTNPRVDELRDTIAAGHNYHFIGRVGLFTPVVPGAGGGILYRSEDQVKYDAVADTKGYRFLESDMIPKLGLTDAVDMRYYDTLLDQAIYDMQHAGSTKEKEVTWDVDKFIHADTEEFRAYIKDHEFGQYMNEPVDEIPFR